jgi:hypothetical protein
MSIRKSKTSFYVRLEKCLYRIQVTTKETINITKGTIIPHIGFPVRVICINSRDILTSSHRGWVSYRIYVFCSVSMRK